MRADAAAAIVVVDSFVQRHVAGRHEPFPLAVEGRDLNPAFRVTLDQGEALVRLHGKLCLGGGRVCVEHADEHRVWLVERHEFHSASARSRGGWEFLFSTKNIFHA